MILVHERANPFVYNDERRPLYYDFVIKEETCINGDKTRNIYKQKLSLKLVARHGNNSFNFNITTIESNFELDNKLKKQELLVRELAELTKAISIEVDRRGDINKVLNHNELKMKWAILKTELKNKHVGDLAHAYIDAITEKIKSSAFTSEFSQYRLFGFLFNGGLGLPFDSRKPIQRKRFFKNFIHYLPLRVNETMELIEENKEDQEITYKITGDLMPLPDKESKRLSAYFDYYDIKDKELFLKTYDGQYVIDKYSAKVKRGWLSINLTNNKEYIRTMNFKLEQINYGG